MANPILGIDLGTTNSVVALSDLMGAGNVQTDERGRKVHPSVVSFHPKGHVLVGDAAKQRRTIDAQNTVYSVKRLIGRTFDSPEVRQARERLPFQIIEGDNNQPLIQTRAGNFAVPEISAIVLDHMRRLVKQNLAGGEEVRAVITAPANFTDAQRSATATAGAIAGLTVVRVLSEPTAAALAYGHLRKLNKTIAVFDFGGGTFDISVLKLDGDVFEVLGTAGDTYLGGDDIDDRLVEILTDRFLAESRVDLRGQPESLQSLRAVAEQAKIELSRADRSIIRVNEIAYGPGGSPIDFNVQITRDEFIHHIGDIVDRAFPVCQEALNMAGVRADQIEDVLLVGGSTKMPYIRERVSQFFGRTARAEVNPDEAVALGAAIQANALAVLLAGPSSRGGRQATTHADTVRTPRKTSKGVGAKTMKGAAVAKPPSGPKATPVPLARITPTKMRVQRKAAVEVTRAVTPPPASPSQKTLSDQDLDSLFGSREEPDTTVRDIEDLEAELRMPLPPVQAGEVTVQRESTELPTVLEMTSHSLGIATIGGFCEKLISRQTQLPAQKARTFASSRDNQNVVRIRVCQGESRRLVDNTMLGDLVLDGLVARPRGKTVIEVTFRIDASGLLRVEARDQATGAAQNVQLRIEGAQSPEEVLAAQKRLQQLRS